jgi:hypothetical protein
LPFGLFFIAVGASIDFNLIAGDPGLIDVHRIPEVRRTILSLALV